MTRRRKGKEILCCFSHDLVLRGEEQRREDEDEG